MDWTLEVVMVPVSDVDRARNFYRDKPTSTNGSPQTCASSS